MLDSFGMERLFHLRTSFEVTSFSNMNALDTVREGPVVGGVEVGVDERAGDAVKGGSVVRIL